MPNEPATPTGESLPDRPHGTPHRYRLGADGHVPNHPELPLLVIPGALPADDADALEIAVRRALAAHDWCDAWTGGVFPYRHYHTRAHELLVVLAGRARIAFGGPEHGVVLEVGAGDVAILPAGTGHENLGASDDFLVLGAYPCGQEVDVVRADEPVTDAQRARIRSVARPAADPLFGRGGPLDEAWGTEG